MKKNIKLFVIITASLALIWLGCISAEQLKSLQVRVIKQDQKSAVIQGIGITTIEAKMLAEEKARQIFTDFKETRKADCTQEYYASGSEKGGSYSASGSTYWSCIIYVDKK